MITIEQNNRRNVGSCDACDPYSPKTIPYEIMYVIAFSQKPNDARDFICLCEKCLTELKEKLAAIS